MTAEVAAALHPPRLPEAFTQGGVADYLLAFGLGLALAAVLLWLFRPALVRRPRPPALAARIAEARALPGSEAMAALAVLARDRGLSLTPAEQAALYARAPDPAMAEALARRMSQRGAR